MKTVLLLPVLVLTYFIPALIWKLTLWRSKVTISA